MLQFEWYLGTFFYLFLTLFWRPAQVRNQSVYRVIPGPGYRQVRWHVQAWKFTYLRSSSKYYLNLIGTCWELGWENIFVNQLTQTTFTLRLLVPNLTKSCCWLSVLVVQRKLSVYVQDAAFKPNVHAGMKHIFIQFSIYINYY